ncbi:hypothetical protein PRIEUP_LOCUS144 [Pristimantis euphronides]
MRPLRILCTVIIAVLCIEPKSCNHACSNVVIVHAAVGEIVVLQINETEVKEISWTLGGNHIVTIESGKPAMVKDRKLEKRLLGSHQGSLKIMDVHMEDQGEYSATVFKEKIKDCVQHFRVKIYPKLSNKDIVIKSNVSGTKNCSVTLTCTVNKSDVTVFWSNQKENSTVIRDHTITLSNTHPDSIYNCTAENPVIRTSRSITPWIFCQKGTATSLLNPAGSHLSWIPIVVVMMFILKPLLCS